jgi:hypothetical protein
VWFIFYVKYSKKDTAKQAAKACVGRGGLVDRRVIGDLFRDLASEFSAAKKRGLEFGCHCLCRV